MIFSNTHDFQHVAVMHGATMEFEPESFDVQEHRIEFENQVHDPTLGDTCQHFKIFGANTLTLANQTGQVLSCPCSRPPPPARGRPPLHGHRDAALGADSQAVIAHKEHFARAIMEDDNPVLKTTRLRPNTPIVIDGPLMRWFRRAADYPAAHPSRELIS